MAEEAPNLIDLSADAALELEELRQGKRNDTPSVTAFFQYLREPANGFAAGESISMLADVRSFPVLRDAFTQGTTHNSSANAADFSAVADNYFKSLERGIADNAEDSLSEAKLFFLFFNRAVLSRAVGDIYARREQSDLRYVAESALS